MANSVLLVCQEELRAQLSIRMIRAAQMEVRRVSRPEEVADVLHKSADVQVVLCDWRLAATEGAEWVDRWRKLTGRASTQFLLMADRPPTPTEAKAIFDKGVADLWVRPVPDYLILPRLKVWLSMARDSGSGPLQPPVPALVDLIDPDTFLLGRRLFLEQAEGMFAGSRRLGTYVGFLAVAISNMENVLARLGPTGRREAAMFLAGELRLIKRREDLLARWDDEVFVMASYFPKGESVEAFGRRLLEALQNSRFPRAEEVGPLRFTVSGAWGPSRDYILAKDALEAIVYQAKSACAN